MDVSGLPGGEAEGKGHFHGKGSNRRLGWLRRNRVPLIMITSLCVFSLIYTSYWITENTTWKLPHLNMSVAAWIVNNTQTWKLPRLNEWISKKYPHLQSSGVVQLEHPPKILCALQKPDPFAPRMMALINMTIFRSNHSCADDPAVGIFKRVAFHLEKGHLLVRDVKFPGDVKCCLKVVTRVDDESVSIHDCSSYLSNEINQTTGIESPTEVILVSCNNSKGENYYTDGFQIFHEKPKVETRIRTWEEEQLKSKMQVNDDGRLSVILFGIDTVSQMHFERSMPLTKSYLEKDLKAVKLKGYNKVSSGTFLNFIAFLNLHTDQEFSRRCLTLNQRIRNANCPFIWNTFASHGYRTAYFEDETGSSIFNHYFRNAFGDYPYGPTDYYGRPYALLMGKGLNFNGLCHGPRLSFQHFLDNVKTMAHLFNSSDRPYFNLIWSVKLSHDSLDTLHWGDKPLLETLKYLRGNAHLNHTAFFLLADHGPRKYDDIYESMIENRMPVAYILLPPWFSQRYPKAFTNLRWNGENSVASHFDMHKTLLDMLDLNRFDTWKANRYFQPENPEMAKRGQSLFELNPQGRNCESAGIPPMWCLCHEMVIPLKNDSLLALSAAEALMEEVNRIVQKIGSHKCETLRLADIVNDPVILFNEETWTKPECRRLISNATSQAFSSCTDKIYISLRIRASPHDAVFHSMMLRNTAGAFTPSEIVREDWYSIKGNCVHNNVRPYCICKGFQ